MATASVDFNEIIDESSKLLLADTPPESAMEGYSQRIRDEYLKGTKFGLNNANLEDSSEFIKEVLANVAETENVKATVADVQKWSTMTFDQLAAEQPRLVEGTAMASAQAGMDVASSVYGESFEFFSLGANALQDGSISVGEAVQLGASAASLASTMIAGISGGCAFGPIGAIAGLVLGGINFLSADAAAHKAYWEARSAQAQKIAESEETEVNRFLENENKTYRTSLDLLWQSKDTALAEVADNWAAFEDSLGVRFGLRYFPGSTIPPRAGVYRSTMVQGATRYWTKSKYQAVDVPGQTRQSSIPMECGSLSGCLYFPEPHPKRVEAVGYKAAFVEMLQQMDKQGMWLTTDDAKYLNTDKDYVPSRSADYPEYVYYHRTIRAFDSFLISGRFWTPPGQRDMNPLWKDYRDLSYDRYCTLGNFCTGVERMPYTTTQRATGFKAITSWYTFNPNTSSGMTDRALQYVKQQFEELSRQSNQVDVIKTRITGDLIQTSNAVGAELATALRLQELMSRFGANLSQVSASEMRTITALDSNTMSNIDRAKVRDGFVNNGMLVAGLGAAGFGAYRKWGRR